MNRADVRFFPNIREHTLIYKIESGSTIAVSHIFNILMDILSWPCTLSSFNDFIMLIISLFMNLVKESLVFAL